MSVLLVAVLLATPGGTSTRNTAEIVSRVQEQYDATRDLKARVEQEIVLADTGQVLRAKGRVYFAKPGRMRWEVEDGERQVVVTDGKVLWFYQPEEKQVLKAPFEHAFRSTSPISFLTGVGKIERDFLVSLTGNDDDLLRLRLDPKHEGEDLGTLYLLVDSGTYEIVGAEVEDPLGNLTRLRFFDVQRNQGVDPDLFAFDPPPGADIIDAPLAY